MVSLRNFTNKCVLKCGSLVIFFPCFSKATFTTTLCYCNMKYLSCQQTQSHGICFDSSTGMKYRELAKLHLLFVYVHVYN